MEFESMESEMSKDLVKIDSTENGVLIRKEIINKYKLI